MRDTPAGGPVSREEFRTLCDLALRALATEVDAPDYMLEERWGKRDRGEHIEAFMEWRIEKNRPPALRGRSNDKGELTAWRGHPLYAQGHPDFQPGITPRPPVQ